ncbi:hypothetical protein GPECTOR_110g216 [Gonium pectorale]|uniref:Uncharacterized protein n=1 Tax=Gonium pectorale TaxID=33097 RepID=A0A150FZ98_GONPE|nr:hypothetical protein GPECTOR_110g216 [Gonium pectorale]|eukprot:KXZ42924.1 hypothetical protein GPECTOR_110g216 [Gonium pectorale]
MRDLKRSSPDSDGCDGASKVAREDNQSEADADAKPQSERELLQDRSSALERRAEDLAFKKFMLETLVRDFHCRVCDRIITGKPPPPGESPVLPAGANCKAVDAFIQAVGMSPADFAAAAEAGHGDPTNGMHAGARADAELESEAKRLMACGAVRLLKDELPAACLFIEHFAKVKEHLFA